MQNPQVCEPGHFSRNKQPDTKEKRHDQHGRTLSSKLQDFNNIFRSLKIANRQNNQQEGQNEKNMDANFGTSHVTNLWAHLKWTFISLQEKTHGCDL